jgi:spore coat protein U-like protein
MKLRFALLAALALCLAATSTFAGTTSTNMTVSATVQGSCSVSADPLPFPAYDPTAPDQTQGLTQLRYTCATGLNPVISLSGVNGAGDGTHYDLANGVNHLFYSLHSGGYTQTTWGNSTGYTVTGTGDGAQHTLTIYGVIAPGQNVANGSYTDTITIELTF